MSAVDQEIMDLSDVSVHQHSPAAPAAVVHGVRAGDQDRWREHGAATGRQANNSEIFVLPLAHAASTLSADRAIICAI